MKKAAVRHILVQTETECLALRKQIEEGTTFAAIAREHSVCPSKNAAGNLGEYPPGHMVDEFDHVMFNGEIGVLHGPVKTEFGYHLIEVLRRSE